MRNYVLAFLLGVFCTLAVQRWIAIETALHMHEMHIAYIEGFLERATR